MSVYTAEGKSGGVGVLTFDAPSMVVTARTLRKIGNCPVFG